MFRKKEPMEDVTFTWREGRFIDLWLLPHLFGGGMFAFFFLWQGGTRALSYGITFVLLAGWELVEEFAGVRETQENRVLDIVVGIAGFVLGYEIGILTLDRSHAFILFLFAVVVVTLLILFGWLDYRKRRREGGAY